MKTLSSEELNKIVNYLSKQPYAEVFQLMSFLLAPDKKPEEKKPETKWPSVIANANPNVAQKKTAIVQIASAVRTRLSTTGRTKS